MSRNTSCKMSLIRVNISQKINNGTTFIQENFYLVCPEILNVLLLSICLMQMYNKIEIGHPVFKILFCNLTASLISSGVNVVAFPLFKTVQYRFSIAFLDQGFLPINRELQILVFFWLYRILGPAELGMIVRFQSILLLTKLSKLRYILYSKVIKMNRK